MAHIIIPDTLEPKGSCQNKNRLFQNETTDSYKNDSCDYSAFAAAPRAARVS